MKRPALRWPPPSPPLEKHACEFPPGLIGLQWRGSRVAADYAVPFRQVQEHHEPLRLELTQSCLGGGAGETMNVLSKPRGRLLKETCAHHHVCTISVLFFFFLSEGLNRVSEFVFECLYVCSGLTACTIFNCLYV